MKQALSLFGRSAVTGLLCACLICAPITISGCNQNTFQSVMQKIAAYMPVALKAANGVLAILVTAGVLTAAQQSAADPVEQAVTNDFNLLCGSGAATTGKCDPASLIGAYLSSPTPTAFSKIVALLNDLQAHLKAIETAFVAVSQKTEATITAAVSLILTTISSIEAQFPAVAAQLRAGASVVKLSMPFSPKGLKNQFNAIVTQGGFSSAAIR